MKNFSEVELNAVIMADPLVRRSVTRKSHYWFFHVYFAHHVRYKTADFHKEIFRETQDPSNPLLIVTAFRGSAKTTILGLSFPIWAVLGCLKKKHILIVSYTLEQAKRHFSNIRSELESNKILLNDLGPFKLEEEWNSYSITLPNYGAKITIASSEQGIRGIKFEQHRPDLIVIDDIENLDSVRTVEARNKTYNWITGELLPAGDKDTQVVIIGNLLHEDSAIMRIKDAIEAKKMLGRSLSYPIVDSSGQSMWPGKYPTMEDIEKEKMRIGDEMTWQREYHLKIVPPIRIIPNDWIHWYDRLPNEEDLIHIATGMDLASTTNETSDYTAMVSGRIYNINGEKVIYILPNPVHAKMEHPEIMSTAKQLSLNLGDGIPTLMYVESNGYQRSVAQQLRADGMSTEEVSINGVTKEERLKISSTHFKEGRILFPRTGVEELVNEIKNFGATKHDDLVDALTLLTNQEMSKQIEDPPEVWFV